MTLPPPATGSRFRLYAPLLLLGIVLACFYPLVSAQFTTWDDDLWIGRNSAVNPPSLESLATHWAGPFADLYTPLTHTLWHFVARLADTGGRVEGALFVTQLDAVPFHVVNLIVHLLSTLVLYFILRRLQNGTSPMPALIGAGLFALHPIVVEPVAWVSGLKDLLCTLFMLLALLTAVRAGPRLEGAGAGRGFLLLLPTLAALALALLSKATAVVLPVMLGAVLWYFNAGVRWRSWLLPGLVTVAMTVPIAVLADRWQVHAGNLHDGAPLLLRPLVLTDTYGFYLSKLLYPVGFCIDYSRTPGFAVRELHWVPTTITFVLSILLLSATRDRRVALGALLFVLPILPVSGLRPHDFAAFSNVADHYAYPALPGAAIVLMCLVELAAARWRIPHKGFCVAFAMMAFALIWLGRPVLRAWDDAASLYNHTLAVNPYSMAGNAAKANLFLRVEDFPSAFLYAHQSMGVWAFYPQANMTAGIASGAMGRYRSAVKYYVAAGSLYAKDDAMYHVYVADALRGLGRYDEALRHCAEALKIKPGFEAAERMRGKVLRERADSQRGTTRDASPATMPSN